MILWFCHSSSLKTGKSTPRQITLLDRRNEYFPVNSKFNEWHLSSLISPPWGYWSLQWFTLTRRGYERPLCSGNFYCLSKNCSGRINAAEEQNPKICWLKHITNTEPELMRYWAKHTHTALVKVPCGSLLFRRTSVGWGEADLHCSVQQRHPQCCWAAVFWSPRLIF